MAIAFDSAQASSVTGSATLTFSHTCTGSDRILFVGTSGAVPNGLTCTGITYNGVALTRINSEVAIQTNVKVSLWYLIAPATGANNIVITYSGTNGSTVLRGCSSSYTGALQSGVPDNSATAGPSNVTTISQSVTTVANNCWTVACGHHNSSSISAGAGTTARSTSVLTMTGDSNSLITPASTSYSMAFTGSASNNAGMVIASFAPSVGPSTTIKTVDGVTRTNVKTFLGVASASIKTINGIT